MTAFRPGPRAAELKGLLRLLGAQDDALRRGDLTALGPLAARLAAHCDRIEAGRAGAATDPAERQLAQDLNRQARSSLRHVGAVLAGWRDALALIEAARRPRTDQVYGPGGERSLLSPPAGRLERRS